MNILIIVFTLFISISAYSEVTPQLFIQPSPIFDIFCQQTNFKIDSDLQAKLQVELTEKINLFQNEWDKVVISIIPGSEISSGRKFSRKEYSVALSVCGWIPMGDPVFIINALPFLGESRISRGFQLPMSMDAFISMTHHELLHSLVDNIFNENFWNTSPLLQKYNQEPYNVIVHLHLMAIQKATYEKLNNKSLLTETDKLYRYIGGDYQRSWEIINAEGTEKFLKEIQLYNNQ